MVLTGVYIGCIVSGVVTTTNNRSSSMADSCGVTCPFCSHEFETEFNWMIDDVDCPSCKKTIDMELDGDTEMGFFMVPASLEER